MKYCEKCGTQLHDEAKFCASCGATACSTARANARTTRKTGKVLILIAILVVIAGIIVAGISLFDALANKKLGFQLEYSSRSIESFLTSVCENISGGRGEVVDANSDDSWSNICYVAKVDVKLSNKISREVEMRFYKHKGSAFVQHGDVQLRSTDSKNLFACKKAFLLALEETVGGTSYVESYLTSYDDICALAKDMGWNESCKIAGYNLDDDTVVSIYLQNYSEEDRWYVNYSVYNSNALSSEGIFSPTADPSLGDEETVYSSPYNLVKDGVLTVAVTTDIPPFTYEENGEIRGFEPELIQLLTDEMGLKVEYQNVGFDEIINGIGNGLFDVGISLIGPTEPRREVVDLSDPYFIDAKTNDVYSIAIGKDTGLLSDMNEALKKLSDNGIIEELQQKYDLYFVDWDSLED